jgi:hypothetical protein
MVEQALILFEKIRKVKPKMLAGEKYFYFGVQKRFCILTKRLSDLTDSNSLAVEFSQVKIINRFSKRKLN